MIKKPGGFRWESDSPTKQILITDGKTLWNYNVDLAQATKRTLNQKASVNPATLLSGSIKDLTQGFHITQLSKGNMKIFLLKPKKKVVSFQWVQLKFLNKKLTQMKVLNHLDETSIFSFKHIRLNKTLSPQLFHFKPPAGVDVVNQ